MIELCDIFSLDSPTKQQVLFVRQPFNLSSFRAIFGSAIFYGSRSDSLKFSVSLSAWRAAGVFSHSLISNKNCLLWTSYWILAMRDKIPSIDHYVTYRNEVDIRCHIYISTRKEHQLFSLQARDEVFDKVSVTEICVFLTRRGTVTNFWFFGGLKRIFQEKNHTTFLCLP